MNDLAAQLKALGLDATAASLDDLLARAIERHLAPRDLLEEIVRWESAHRSRRSLERRRVKSRLGTFKPIADFDWNWPKKIDRPLIERALSLEFLREGRNLVLLGPNGVGKTLLGTRCQPLG
jgi:DNA replication protein DnaC